MKPADEDLVRFIPPKNSAAVEAVIRKYDRRLRLTAVRSLRRRRPSRTADTEAEEVVQDVYVAVWLKGIPLVDKTILAYLKGMVRKKALSRLRGERDYDQLDDTLVDVRIDLEAEFEKKERSDQLERKISGLSAEDQQILRLYIDGCSGAEIAAALGITQSAARSRLSRAKDRLSRQ